MMQQILPPGR